MDIVERVARALHAVETAKVGEPWDSLDAEMQSYWWESARAAIEAIERTHRLTPRHISHIYAVCPECGTMDADHAPGCAFSATVQPPR